MKKPGKKDRAKRRRKCKSKMKEDGGKEEIRGKKR